MADQYSISNEQFNEIYSEKIVDKLFADNSFLNYFDNKSMYLSGRLVHIPNYTNTPRIYVDGSDGSGLYDYKFSATDTVEEDLSFTVRSYRVEPIRVENFEEMITNYDKFSAVTKNSVNSLTQTVGDNMLQNIADAVVAGNKLVVENSSSFQHVDMLNIAQKFDEQNVTGDRYIILPPAMYYSLLNDTAVKNSSDFGIANLPKGVVAEVSGIRILKRSKVAILNTNDAAIAFTSDAVVAAWNSPKVYTDSNVPQLYGSVVSSEVAMGAHIGRKDGAGCYTIENV